MSLLIEVLGAGVIVPVVVEVRETGHEPGGVVDLDLAPGAVVYGIQAAGDDQGPVVQVDRAAVPGEGGEVVDVLADLHHGELEAEVCL